MMQITPKKFSQYIIIALIISTSYSAYAQKVDTIIDMGSYKVYYNYQLKQALYVTYNLYKGGGDESRDGMSFKKCGVNSLDDDDYNLIKGYDKGHLANAEDFAYDSIKLEKTFCYFNAVPQTAKLNRGIWRSWETKIRKLSKTKRIFIIAGTIYSKSSLKNTPVVPTHCYKIVVDTKTKEVTHCMLFKNDSSNTYSDISLEELKKKLSYGLMP